MKSLLDLLFIVMKGGAGSGNWGHAGRKDIRGGSAKRATAMSLTTGRDAERRQKAAKQNMFFKGNTKTATVAEIFENSSAQVQKLALETGVLATDQASFDYLTARRASFVKPVPGMGLIKEWEDSGVPHKEYLYKMLVDSHSLNTGKMTTSPDVAKLYLKQEITMYTLLGAYGYDEWSDKFNYQNKGSSAGRELTPQEENALRSLMDTRTPAKKQMGKKSEKYVDNLSDAEALLLGNLVVEANVKRNTLSVLDSYIRSRNLYDAEKRPWDFDVAIYKQTRTEISDVYDQFKNFKMADLIKKASADPNKDFNQELSKLMLPEIEAMGIKVTTKKLSDFAIAKAPLPEYEVKDLMALSEVSAHERNVETERIKSTWDKRNHGGFTSKVNNVFRIKASDTVNARFEKASAVGNVVTNMYHGTHTFVAQKIASDGYKVMPNAKAGRMFGDGIYMADCASKAIQYIGSDFGRGNQNGVIFVNKAAFGKVKVARSRREYSKPDVNTVFGSKRETVQTNGGSYRTLVNDEWAVKNPEAVVPMYWIDIDRINK